MCKCMYSFGALVTINHFAYILESNNLGVSGIQYFVNKEVLHRIFIFIHALLLDYIQVWAVLKPGFLAFLKDPFDTQPMDIIVFDVLPASDGNGEGRVSLAKEVKDNNPLRHYFRVSAVQVLFSSLYLFPSLLPRSSM